MNKGLLGVVLILLPFIAMLIMVLGKVLSNLGTEGIVILSLSLISLISVYVGIHLMTSQGA